MQFHLKYTVRCVYLQMYEGNHFHCLSAWLYSNTCTKIIKWHSADLWDVYKLSISAVGCLERVASTIVHYLPSGALNSGQFFSVCLLCFWSMHCFVSLFLIVSTGVAPTPEDVTVEGR